MSSLASQLARARLQTINLPPDRVIHTLTSEQAGGGSPLPVLYKKQGGNLGKGSFGVVHLEIRESECEVAPRVRAVKTIDKDDARKSNLTWQREIENLIAVSKFPDLFVKIFGWWDDEKFIFLPMEYFENGDLSRCVDQIHDEIEIRTISHQIALGLQKMHGLKIIHRDLKPQNILVTARGPEWKVKIGDFGFSKRLSQSVSDPFSTRGTVKYMAPEYRDLWNTSESSDFTSAVDMWSFGCLIYELFAHKCPFDDGGSASLKRYLKDEKFPQEPLDKCCASGESIWTIKALLKPSPLLRAKAEDLVHCSWFETGNHSPLRKKERPFDANVLAVKDEGWLESSTGTPRTQPQVSIVPGADTSVDPPTLVISAAIDEESRTAQAEEHRPEPLDRTRTTATVTVDELALIRHELPQSSDPSPRLPPRLPPRPKSTSALREHAQEAQTLPHFVNLPHKERDAPAVEVDVIKPSAISIPRKPVPNQMHSKRSIKLAPTLRCLKQQDGQINMYFTDLAFAPKAMPMCDTCEAKRIFNPSIKPAAVYFCKDCDHRPLCARCVFELIRSTADLHEADHKLRPWIQGHDFQFPSFLRRHRMLSTTESGGLEAGFGRAWVDSADNAFAPVAGQMDTSFTLHAPPGEYTITIHLRTLKNGEALRSSTIGHFRTMMVKRTKAIRLGSILIGSRAIEKLRIPSRKELAQQPTLYLPDGCKELIVPLEEEEHPHTIKLERPVKILSGHLLEVNIRGAYDTSFFKAGSPFQWWLDEITVEHFGPEEYVSSMGDRQLRQIHKQRHEQELKAKKRQKNLSLISQGFEVAGKAGSFIPGVKLASGVASGVFKMGATATKSTSHSGSGAGAGAGAGLGLSGAAVPQIVHHNYNMSETHHHIHDNNSFMERPGLEGPEQDYGGGYEVEEPEEGEEEQEEDAEEYCEEYDEEEEYAEVN